MIELPTAGQFYDLVKLITTELDEPFEGSQKSFAKKIDLESELTISEIQNVLFESKKLSVADAEKTNSSEDEVSDHFKSSEKNIELSKTLHPSLEKTKYVQAQHIYQEIFQKFENSLNKVLENKEIEDKERCEKYINRFFNYVHPFIESFSSTSYTLLLLALLSYIENSKTSSVVDTLDAPQNTQEYRNSFDVLKKIPLVEHILDVLEMVVKKISEIPGVASYYEGMFVVGMYHDIGKIDKYIQDFVGKSNYAMIDHALISAEILRRRYSLLNVEENQEYIEAIQYHHKPVKDFPKANKFFEYLKEADHKAREQEISASIDKIPSLTTLLDQEKLKDIVLTMFNIDVDDKLGIPDIFQLKGYLFIKEGKLKDHIKKYLSANKLLCREQYRPEEVYMDVVKSMLVAYSFITEERKKEFPVLVMKSTSARVRNDRKLMNYIALSLELFNMPASAYPKTPQSLLNVETVEFKKYWER